MMSKKFLVVASETITYREEIQADSENQAKDLFNLFYKAGTVLANNSEELDICLIEELKE
jgi:hypothetical protein